MDIKIEVSGNMESPNEGIKQQPFSLSNITNLSTKIPSITELIRESRKNIRPWTEFINYQNFKTITNLQRITNRLMRNLSYFQSNYLFVFLGLLLYCLLTSPLILIVLCLIFYFCYKIKQAKTTITILQQKLNTNQQCIIINLIAIPLLYLTGAGTAIFWVLGASFFFITLHACFYNIDAIVTEDTENFLNENIV